MTPAEMAVQLVFPGHKFGIDDPAQAGLLAEMGVGGFCLFGGLPDEVSAFTADLQRRAPRPLLFSGDYEDGVATQCPGATALSSNMGLGAAGSEELAFEKGAITAAEARAMGVSWVLAPVCDVASAPDNPIVNVRSFSADPDAVSRLAGAYLRGVRSQGALGCVKHFPGHGDTLVDSHMELPVVHADRTRLQTRELVPFAALAGESDAVMTGHLVVPALSGPDVPYSLSMDVSKTLRGDLGFLGLVSTDSLSMQAVAAHYDELDAARRALLGGTDVLLVPPDAQGLIRALGQAVEDDPALAAAVAASHARLARALAKAAEASAPAALCEVGSERHAERAGRMAERCLAWAKDQALPALPKRVSYWEVEASQAEDWQGAPFVEALRDAGHEVTPWHEGAGADALVVGCFLSPRAYTGRIRYEEDEAARVAAALKGAQRAVLVSFGSPFVFSALSAAGLCAFSQNVPAQRAAALALAGRAAVTGRMPVPF